MRLRKGVFTPREDVFVERYAATGDKLYAAEKAGFPHPAQAAHRLINAPRVAEEIHARIAQKRITGGEVALDTLLELATDRKNVPAGVRRAAAADLWKASGVAGSGADEKDMAEMTADELVGMLERAKGILASRAKDITPGSPIARGEADEPAEVDPFG